VEVVPPDDLMTIGQRRKTDKDEGEGKRKTTKKSGCQPWLFLVEEIP
jgi:hypothetical protein